MRLTRLSTSIPGLFLALGLTATSAWAQAQQPRGATPRPQANLAAGGKGAQAAIPPNGEIPEVVATVNGEKIQRNELGRECVIRYGEQVLENMLNKTLIMQACQAQQVVISEKEVDNEIARIATKFSLNPQMYLQLIEDERGIQAHQYKSDIVWPMLALRALARDKIQIDPQEVNQRIENEFGPTVKVRMIAVRDPQKAQQLHQAVTKDPSSFKKMAKEHSEDPTSASVEGLLPPIRRYSGDDEIEKIAFALQPEQISQVINVEGMHLILQCVRHEPATPPSREQLPAIEERIRVGLSDQKLQTMAETMFTTLHSQSNVIKVLGDAAKQQQHPGVAAFINRQQVPMSMLEDECVRRFGAKVLEGEINRKLLEQALASQKKQVTQQDIDNEIARAADYYGFIKADKTPDVEKWLKSVLEEDGATLELYVRDAVWPTVALKKLVEGSIQISDEDLKRGFESSYGPRAEVLAIVLSNQRTAQEVWQMARNNPTEDFFGQLAAQYSVEPTSRSNHGKVPPIRKSGGAPALEKAAFELKAGDMSGIVESQGQFIILRSQGFTNPVVQDFNAVKSELQKDIYERKSRIAMQKYLDDVMKQSMIENYIVPKKSQVGAAVTKEAVRSGGSIQK